MPTYVDTHCHLGYHDQRTVSEQVAAARAAGVTTLVDVGTDPASSEGVVEVAEANAGVWAVVGIHPNDATAATPAALARLAELATRDVVVGIGETGLDHYRDHTTPAQQEDAFRAHVALAREADRTLVIHCRDAWDDCLRVLVDAGPPSRVVMHCFSGGPDVVEVCADHGWYLSFAGNVTFRNAGSLRLAASLAPLDLLLTETDSPFLTPVPLRGRRNEPANVPHVLRQLAQLQDGDEDDVAAAVLANARRAFALPDGG